MGSWGVFLKFLHERFEVRTKERFEVIDVTDKVKEFIYNNSVTNGLLSISVPHTTAAIAINEAERGLMEDIVTSIRSLFNPERAWKHNLVDNNAHAHLAATFIGNSRCVSVVNGTIQLGRWQRVLLIEMDGPRSRLVELTFVGE
ncbi:MAG: secondary thiamine-phosphate synthase enzyme YjbQ [Acidilobus sp.]